MEPPDQRRDAQPGDDAPARRRLLFVFGALYFVQGVAEPTEGLIAQPVRSLLRSWGHDAAAIGGFATLLSIPWMIKPLYGLVTDFVPVFGTRRRGWLLIWTFATAAALAVLWLADVAEGSVGLLLTLLLVPTVGIAFTDVVVDALMVEEGQPRGLTGTLQSMQWGAMYTATILTGWLGGYLSEHGQQRTGFLICALTATGALVVALTMVREPRAPRPKGSLGGAARSLWDTARHPAVALVALFLFFVNFNPFGTSVTYVHMTEALRLDESLYGETISVQAVAAVIASATYAAICRRVAFTHLVWGCVALAIGATLCFLALRGPTSAYAVAAVFGFTSMLASLVQLDMAARYCPPAVAGTVFAILMSVSNLSTSLAEGVGGWLYTSWSASTGTEDAYALLVVTGAAFTALSFFLVPRLTRLSSSQ